MNLVHPSSYWTSTNPVLEPYQIGAETDTNQYKTGDGTTAWNDLTYSKFPFEYSVATGTDTYATTFGKGLLYGNDFIDYYSGLTLWVKFGNANTGAATLNINGLGAKAIKKSVTTALSAADIKAGGIYELVYDGTNFQINISSGSGGSGDVVGPASATDDNIATFDGTTGKLIQDGGKKISDLQLALTDINFGAFNNGLTGKTTPVDADYTVLMDSADSNKEKKLSWANIKATLKTYFDSIYTTTAAVATQITTALSGYLTAATAASTYAPIASPTFTGTPAAPTPSQADNSTKIATTAYVDTKYAGDHLLLVGWQNSGVTQGTWIIQASSSYVLAQTYTNSTTTQNDQIDFLIGVSGGTYTIVLMYTKATSVGIATILVDGSSVGTIDMYAGSTTNNNVSSLTGVSIAAGRRTISIKIATKNASSSQYRIFFNSLGLFRTS